jgi:MYXO-CTERM domain-containing protein
VKAGYLLAGLAVLAARPALADCPQAPLIGNVFVWPALGQTNVPLNTRVLALYPGTATELANPQLALLDAANAPIAATTTEIPMPGANAHLFVLAPTAPLAPSTMYQIADLVNWHCTAEPCSATLGARFVFTTGATTDTTPPLLPVPMVATQVPDVCADGSCCGPFHGLRTTLANPASGAIRYDLYDSGQLVRSDTPFTISTDCAQAGDVPYQAPVPSVTLAPGAHHLTLHAFDIANNEAIGTQALDLNLVCPSIMTPDAGVPAPDAGAPADDGGGGGCSAGGTGSPVFVGLVGLGLAVARRRRR